MPTPGSSGPGVLWGARCTKASMGLSSSVLRLNTLRNDLVHNMLLAYVFSGSYTGNDGGKEVNTSIASELLEKAISLHDTGAPATLAALWPPCNPVPSSRLAVPSLWQCSLAQTPAWVACIGTTPMLGCILTRALTCTVQFTQQEQPAVDGYADCSCTSILNVT